MFVYPPIIYRSVIFLYQSINQSINIQIDISISLSVARGVQRTLG